MPDYLAFENAGEAMAGGPADHGVSASGRAQRQRIAPAVGC